MGTEAIHPFLLKPKWEAESTLCYIFIILAESLDGIQLFDE